MLCLSVDEIRLPFHHSSFQLLHSSFHFCSFLKVTCEPSDRVKKWISWWNYWRRPREQTSSAFSLRLLWLICMVSALEQTGMLLSDDSLESLASEYWTAAWFISQWLQTWVFFGSRAAPEVARSIRNADSSFWLQMGIRSHGHPHTGTQGGKTKPSQPALDISFSLDTIQTPLCCVLWKKPSISADSGWLTLHIERPLAVGTPLDTAAREDVTLRRVSAHSQCSPSASFPRGSRLPSSPSETLC